MFQVPLKSTKDVEEGPERIGPSTVGLRQAKITRTLHVNF